ncbi:MAG: UvrD/REP helicase, partial [bacterium]
MSRRPTDHAIRQAIVTDLDRSCFVEASAGTGKTRLMVERILEIVETGAAQLDQVAAITFTEKAAGELRVRIRDVIGERIERGLGSDGQPLDSERRARLEEARGRL